MSVVVSRKLSHLQEKSRPPSFMCVFVPSPPVVLLVDGIGLIFPSLEVVDAVETIVLMSPLKGLLVA